LETRKVSPQRAGLTEKSVEVSHDPHNIHGRQEM
jgi:hypothetical protein